MLAVVQIVGFQFGLYHVVASLSFSRSISLASLFAIPRTLALYSLLHYNLPFVGLDLPGDMAPEDESEGDKRDRYKYKKVGELGKRQSSPRRSEAQSQQTYPKLEIRLCSQLNSCFLDRKHRAVDSRNLEFFER